MLITQICWSSKSSAQKEMHNIKCICQKRKYLKSIISAHLRNIEERKVQNKAKVSERKQIIRISTETNAAENRE